MKDNTEVATTENKQQVQVIDFNKPLPDLTDSKTMPFDLMADYWTPETAGESKRVFFDRIGMRGVKDMQNEEAIIELECAFFVEVVNGEAKSVSNGSKRLVGAILSNGIKRGTPLLITFLGKKSNKTNAFKSDSWSVKPLIVNI